MKNVIMILSSPLFWAMPAMAQYELIDPKTHEYISRGIIASMIAGAQVSEMRCGTKNQINLALAKAKRLGMPFNLDEKEDYSDVVFLASQLLTRLHSEGVTAWCKDKAPALSNFIQSP